MGVASDSYFERVLLSILYMFKPSRRPMREPPPLGTSLAPLKTSTTTTTTTTNNQHNIINNNTNSNNNNDNNNMNNNTNDNNNNNNNNHNTDTTNHVNRCSARLDLRARRGITNIYIYIYIYLFRTQAG